MDWAAEPLEPSRAAPGGGRGRERLAWLTILLTTAVLIVLVIWLVIWNRAADAPAATLRTVVNLPEGHTLQDMRNVPFDVSPDGRRLVFTAFDPTKGWGQLFVRDLQSFVPRPITEPTISIEQPFFSPDGDYVGFVSATRNLIFKVSIDGGAPTEMARLDRTPRGLAWMEDGSILFGAAGSGLWRVSEQGGMPEPLTRLKDGEITHEFPHALPDDRGVLFTVGTGGVAVAVLEAGATEHRELIVGQNGFYIPSGHLVFVSEAGSLMAARFDIDTLEIRGTPVPIADSVAVG